MKIDYTRDSLFDALGLQRLKESYMMDNETSPQERFAYVSEKFASNPEHAQRLYDYSSQHWLSYSTPILSYGRSKRGLPISCFAAGTPILTKNGVINIEDVQEGTEVLTHKGRFRPVEATRTSSSSDMYIVQSYGNTTKLHVTGNHRLLTNRGWVRVDELKLDHDLLAHSHYVERQDQEAGLDLTTYTEVSYSHAIPSSITLDKDLAWAFGFWFAEGSTTDNGSVRVTHGDKEPCEKWGEIMSKVFGTGYTLDSPKDRNWFNATLFSVNVQRNFDVIFGKGCKDKQLPASWMNMDKELFDCFMEGFYLGDGYKTTNKKMFEITNVKMASQLALLLLKHGYSVSTQYKKYIAYNKTKNNGVYNAVVSFADMYEQRVGSITGFVMQDGLRYTRIKSIEAVQELTTVYDIQVAEDESFSAAGIIAHNCFLNYMDDSAEGLVENLSETNWLSMLGGGVGVHVGIRNSDDKSVGVMPHLKIYDSSSLAYRQGRTRRGSYAAFLDISHPDIVQFIEMRKPTGDQNLRTLNLHHGVNITDKFMQLIEACMKDGDADDTWELINPSNGEVVDTISAKYLWQKLLELRMQTGEPYFVFIDEANRQLPQHLKDKGLTINGSNLCVEVMLPSSKERTAVCCLSSLNLEYYDSWKNHPQFIKDVLEMLDNVLTVFINEAPKGVIDRAIHSAMMERSVGIGALGFHAYLQKNTIPMEGVMAKIVNNEIFKHIKAHADKANEELATERGSCPDALSAGLHKRFSHTMAIAPNASSSLIMGNTSPSIEPYRANVFRQDTLSGAYVYKNRFLQDELQRLGMDDDDTWASIIANDGSVQHLSISDTLKASFKTAMEIDQRWLVELAGDRQKYIDQGQSLNLFFPPDTSIKYLHTIHFSAWKQGLKSLYYLRSDKVRKADKVGAAVERKAIEEKIDLSSVVNGDSCLACE